MKLIALIIVTAVLALPWCINLYKGINCDFEAPYRCEIIHGTGVFIPPAAYVTVWFDSDK